MLEAVERAAATATHLRFAPRAFETAADAPFRRPGLVLRALRQLDGLAGRFAAGDMGMSLSQAAPEVGITQWKNGVSELARTRWRDEYLVTIDGQEVELGPHIALGSGSGRGLRRADLPPRRRRQRRPAARHHRRRRRPPPAGHDDVVEPRAAATPRTRVARA